MHLLQKDLCFPRLFLEGCDFFGNPDKLFCQPGQLLVKINLGSRYGGKVIKKFLQLGGGVGSEGIQGSLVVRQTRLAGHDILSRHLEHLLLPQEHLEVLVMPLVQLQALIL